MEINWLYLSSSFCRRKLERNRCSGKRIKFCDSFIVQKRLKKWKMRWRQMQTWTIWIDLFKLEKQFRKNWKLSFKKQTRKPQRNHGWLIADCRMRSYSLCVCHLGAHSHTLVAAVCGFNCRHSQCRDGNFSIFMWQNNHLPQCQMEWQAVALMCRQSKQPA